MSDEDDTPSVAEPTDDAKSVNRAERLEQVRETLQEVFERSRDEAADLVRPLAKAQRSLPIEAWHIDPFQIAADLAEREEVSTEDKRRYAELRRRWQNAPHDDVPSGADLRIDMPKVERPGFAAA